ncbi:MAG: DUF3488 and transglutaminase-like domain-containing protein, partial [Shewanella sp.]|nr:DUF3488 and transglutaminase-like domain-containing protein [Shewanella sp.]
ILVGYFLIALTFVNNQAILSTLHLLLVTAVNTAGLISLYQSKTRLLDPLTGAATVTLLSLPLAALLFLVLPRFSPLWMLPDTNKATTGLSDTVRPGDIRNLTRSAQLAFRATFYGNVPPNKQLYWRALVLDSYDGKEWSQNPLIKALQANPHTLSNQRHTPKGTGLSYQVIAEPSGTHWLFALDLGYSDNRGVVNLADARLFAKRQVKQRFGYNVTSYFDAVRDLQLSPSVRLLNLYLPPDSNPRTREWGQQLTQQFPQPAMRVQHIMSHFAKQPYFYTLSPPATGVNQIDDFLFDNRAGFCVHYASALVVLARASGLPARMVAGYQGGEYNDTAGYVSVYQYMAHAWAEIWLPERGWVSFDPTAMVAPQRVLDGFDAQFSAEESYLLDNPLSSLRLKNWPWLDQWRLYLSSLDYYWSVWVLGFNSEKQNRLLKALLGSDSTERIGLFILGGILAVLTLLGWYTGLLRLPRRRDKLLRRYQRLLQALKQLGVALSDGDGPRTVAAKVCQFNPHWQDAITGITETMEHLIFDPMLDTNQTSALRNQCLSQIERLLLLIALYRSAPNLIKELPGKAAT